VCRKRKSRNAPTWFIAIGGDGTLLYAARLVAHRGVR